MQNASLVVVGSGIKFLSHLTHEARIYIEQSEKVLYLVNDPAMKGWIRQTNECSLSLDFLYSKYPLRLDCYEAITEFILTTLRTQIHLCVVLYGHPGVFAQPGLDAVTQARAEGFYAKLLPGVSAEACLFADLLIDPGTYGCQSFEATDFLVYQRKFDPNSYLILWQSDVIGILDNPQTGVHKKGIEVLCNYLEETYDSNHELIVYEAAQYPCFDPIIQKCPLKNLIDVNLSRISTLCIPPIKKSKLNSATLKKLNIKVCS